MIDAIGAAAMTSAARGGAGTFAFHVRGVVTAVGEPGEPVLGAEVLGTDDDLADLRARGIVHAAVGVGSVGDSAARRAVHERACAAGFALPPIVHPTAVVAESASLGEGCFIAANAVIGPDVVVGDGAIVNTNAVCDHDCTIGAFAHVAPGALAVRIGAGWATGHTSAPARA